MTAGQKTERRKEQLLVSGRKYYHKNAEKRKSVAIGWKKTNAERARAYSREYASAHQDQIKTRYLSRVYGITLEAYNDLLQGQGGGCRVCGATPDVRVLCVDHDHIAGVIRGILCRACNVGIGNLSDDPVLLQRAADYLKESVPF